MKAEIKIGLLGFGTVGGGVQAVLTENAAEIAQKAGAAVSVKTVLVRDPGKKRKVTGNFLMTDKIEDILEDKEIDIVIELMGGIHPAKEYMLQAMAAGKHVVTANKDVVAEAGTGNV